MIAIFSIAEAGAKGLLPLSPAPQIPADPDLRFAPDKSRLTIPNTYSTITMPASLRSDCCSPSLRNAVRLPSGNDVHLHRNTHTSTIVVVDCAPCHQPELRTLLTTNGLLSFFDLKGQSEDEERQVLSIVVTSRQ